MTNNIAPASTCAYCGACDWTLQVNYDVDRKTNSCQLRCEVCGAHAPVATDLRGATARALRRAGDDAPPFSKAATARLQAKALTERDIDGRRSAKPLPDNKDVKKYRRLT